MVVEVQEISAEGTSLDLSKNSTLDNYANRRGMEIQQNLCDLLKSLDYVLGVRETIKDSTEDRQKIDIVVSLDRRKKILSYLRYLSRQKPVLQG